MEIEKKIKEMLEKEIQPLLESHSGGARFMGFEDGVVWIELLGACVGCPASDISTRVYIEEILCEAIPEVKRVELTQEIDPELLSYAQKIISGELK